MPASTDGGRSKTADKGGRHRSNGLGRVEYLPIEWHTRFKGRLYRESGGGGGVTATRGMADEESGSADRRAAGVADDKSGGGNASGRGCGSGDDKGSRNVGDSERYGSDTDRTEAMSGRDARRHGSVRTGLEWEGTGHGREAEKRRIFAGNKGGGGGEAGEGEVETQGGLSIWDITLPRAPTLRAFTNDTLLDILYFMSPEYHQVRPGVERVLFRQASLFHLR